MNKIDKLVIILFSVSYNIQRGLHIVTGGKSSNNKKTNKQKLKAPFLYLLMVF